MRTKTKCLVICLTFSLASCHKEPAVSREWQLGKELRSAAGFAKREDVLRLLRQGADVNAKDNLGETPLTGALTMYASYIQFKVDDPGGGLEERRAVIKLLLEEGANPNVVGERAKTPLMNAAASGDEEIVQMLLDAGAASTLKQMDVDGQTARDHAIAQGRERIAEKLGSIMPK